MANTTTITTTILGYYTGITYSASTEPTSTAASDHLTRAQNWINEQWPNCGQYVHDQAVLNMCINFHAQFKQNKEASGGTSYGGPDKVSMGFPSPFYLSLEVKEMLSLSERKTHPILETFDLF